MSDEFIREILSALRVKGLLDKLNEAPCHAVQLAQSRFQQLRSLFQTLYTEDQKAESLLRGYLGVLLLEVEKEFHQPLRERALRGKQADLVEAAVRYVDAHYGRKITLESVADALFVSKYHLSHVFSQTTGTSLVNYIQCRRVLEAQKLLMKGELTNQQISLLCGFESIQHFYRVFKKITGQVPGSYRRPPL